MSDDWVLAVHTAIERDVRAVTDPDDLPDEPDDGGVQTVRWDRVATPGGVATSPEV